MPINQPPISEDVVRTSWDYEATRIINELEQRLGAAEITIASLEARVKLLEDNT